MHIGKYARLLFFGASIYMSCRLPYNHSARFPYLDHKNMNIEIIVNVPPCLTVSIFTACAKGRRAMSCAGRPQGTLAGINISPRARSHKHKPQGPSEVFANTEERPCFDSKPLAARVQGLSPRCYCYCCCCCYYYYYYYCH